jgi:HEAT repeat protein
MKRYMLIGLIAFAAMAVFADSEELQMYTDLYNGADTIAARLVILRQAAEAKLPDSAEFFARALTRLNGEYPDIRINSERDAADASARLICPVLGDAKYTAAGPDLWRLADSMVSLPLSQNSSLVRADAITALGRVNAVAFLPQVALLLQNLNDNSPADRNLQIQNERIAYGAIIALENYRDPAGYLPVFFASTGWYSNRIKNQASISLPNIMDDPTEQLVTVVKGPGYGYAVKHLALRTEERSQASNENKAVVAVAALGEGWRASTGDVHLKNELGQMRKLAISMIRRYGTQDAAVYPLLERSYKEGIDMNERLDATEALAALGSEDAARVLMAALQDLHTRRTRDTWGTTEEQLIRRVIPALGDTRQTIARPILDMVRNSPVHTGAIQVLARNAIQKISGR